jgi:hypothetical protein
MIFAGRFTFQDCVRCQDRHARRLHGPQKGVHSPVELVIANDPGVIAQVIKQIYNELPFAAQTDISSLINVSDIDQDGIPILPAPSPDLSDTPR